VLEVHLVLELFFRRYAQMVVFHLNLQYPGKSLPVPVARSEKVALALRTFSPRPLEGRAHWDVR
jgi:hypothetical protein